MRNKYLKRLVGKFLCKIGYHDWKKALGTGFPPEVYKARCRRCQPIMILQDKPGIISVIQEEAL